MDTVIERAAAGFPGEMWVPVRAARFEVRWFTEGDLPRHERPRGPSVRRVDAYHCETLSADLAIKRRGDTGRWECKARSRVTTVELGDVVAPAERWQKWQTRRSQVPPLVGPWIGVRKQVWSLDGIEVARVSLDERWWWTLAFAVGTPEPSRHKRARRWIERFDASSRAGSYATWLLEQTAATRSAAIDAAPGGPHAEGPAACQSRVAIG